MSSPLGALDNLAETIVIKDGNVFMVTLRDGRLPADVEHPLGLLLRDCRFLCAHEWGLGLSPDALDKRLRVIRPSLPRWLERVEVTGLEIGSSRVDLQFERAGEHVTLADARIDGDLEVVLEIAGDRRRMVDP